MSPKKFLIFYQDLGGSRLLDCIIDQSRDIINSSNSCFMIHKQSSLLKDTLINRYKLNQVPTVVSKFKVKDWYQLLKSKKITHVICSLSSKNLDMSNANLIQASRELALPSLGFMDHWKGFDRLYDKQGDLKFSPTTLGVIDDYSKNKAALLGLNKSNILIAGNPLLEELEKSFNKQRTEIKSATFISQPDNINGSYKSLFTLPVFKNKSLIDYINNVLAFKEFQIFLRPHPKELSMKSNKIKIDNSSRESLLEKHSLSIGINSIMLLESFLSGNPLIKIKFDEFSQYEGEPIPIDFGKLVFSLDELKIEMFKVFSGNFDRNSTKLFEGSMKASQEIIHRFTSNNNSEIIP